MSHHEEQASQTPPGSDRDARETSEVVLPDAFPTNDRTIDTCQDDKWQELSGTCHDTNVDNPSIVLDEITRELTRFILLVSKLRESGVSQAEMARRTGIDSTHINKLCNPKKYGYTGLSTDIVRKVRDGLNLSTDLFFDETLRGDDVLNVYSLDEERQKKWQRSVEDRLHEFSEFRHESKARMLELQAALERKDGEIDRLKRELSQVPKRRPTK